MDRLFRHRVGNYAAVRPFSLTEFERAAWSTSAKDCLPGLCRGQVHPTRDLGRLIVCIAWESQRCTSQPELTVTHYQALLEYKERRKRAIGKQKACDYLTDRRDTRFFTLNLPPNPGIRFAISACMQRERSTVRGYG